MTRPLSLAAALLLSGCSLAVDPGDLPAPPIPGAPTGLSASAGNGQATLSWNARSGDVVRYDIHRGVASGSLAKIAETSGGASTFVATGLTNGTTYFFAVAAVDSGGKLSALSDETSATPFLPDTVPPNVVLASPGNAAVDVPLDASFVVSFSERMDPATVTVSTTPALVLGPPGWSADGATVSFEPAVFASLVAETSYAVQVAGADPAGNSTVAFFHFSTVAVPPTLDATTPSMDATGVPTGAAIQLVFSERMNASSVEAAVSAFPAVACTWSWSGDGTTATCLHATPFTAATQYVVTIGTGAMDSPAGAHLVSAASFGFTTASAPDVQPPTVASSTPASSATGAPRATTIAVTFSEAVDKVAAQAAFAITSPAGYNPADGGLFTWSLDGLTMTYDPPADLPYGQLVQWRLTTTVRDLAGNYMAAPLNRSFTVIRTGTATLLGVAGLDGYLASNVASYVWASPLYAGDGAANQHFRGFVSFDLGGVPASATAITAATLYAYQYTVAGNPYAALGSLRAESVDYGTSLDFTDLNRAALQWFGRQCTISCTPICRALCLTGWWDDVYTLSTSSTVGYKSVDVTGKVERDRAARTTRGNRSQFRLQFETDTDSNAAAANAGFYSAESASNRPYLYVTYEYP